MIQDYNGVIPELTKVMEKEPENVFAYYYRGVALFNKGKKKEARLDLLKSKELGMKEDVDGYLARIK